MSKDGELDKYLEGKSELSKLYAELPRVELPDHLDAAILAEAHRAVNSRPGAKSKRRWTIPLGMVATLFVAVMIGLQLPYILQDAAAPQQYKEEKIAAMMDKGMAEQSTAATEERKKVQETDRVMSSARSDLKRGEPAPMAAEVEAPAKMNTPVRAAPRESSGTAEATYTPAAQPAAKSVGILQKSTAAESSQSRSTSVVASPPPPVAAAPAPAPVSAAKRIELSESGTAGSGMAVAKEKKASGNAAGNKSESFEQRAPAATRLAAPQPAKLDANLLHALKDEASAENLNPERLTPENWVIRIKKLQQEGKLEEVKKELAAFKKRYPDYPVPRDMEVR